MKGKIKTIILKLFSLFKIKNIIILESVPTLTDNTKSFYDYLIKNNYNKKYKIIWFTDDKSHDKVSDENVKLVKVWKNISKLSFFGIFKYCYYLKNAKYILFCNRNVHKLNQKSITIYLSHGIPLKNVRDIKLVPPSIDYVVSPSEYVSELFADQFRVAKEKIVVLGTARNDSIYNYQKINRSFDFINQKYKKVILWMPTFRDHAGKTRHDSSFSFPLGIPVIYDFSSLKKIDELLGKNDMLLLIKPHPVQDMSKICNINLSNIKLINDDELKRNSIMLFEFFFYIDAFMTDYSAVYYDMLLTNCPIGFTFDDFEEYNKTRGFSFDDPLDKMAGMKIRELNDLVKFINDVSSCNDTFKEKRDEIIKLFYDKIDGNSCDRIAKYFKF